MKKKTYQTPSVQTFEIALTQTLLADSLTGIGGNAGIGYGGGGNGGARSPEQILFDEFDD